MLESIGTGLHGKYTMTLHLCMHTWHLRITREVIIIHKLESSLSVQICIDLCIMFYIFVLVN